MMRGKLSRRTAWQKVAEVFDGPSTPVNGMCCVYSGLTGDGAIYRLLDDLHGKCSYWWPCDARHAPLRATFAGLMAAMTDRERDQLVKGL